MARTLSEVYPGMLSRDWPRLLEILQSGEHRAVLMTRGGDRFADTGDYGDAQNATSCIEFLKREGAWWLPAPGDMDSDVNSILKANLPAKIKHLKGE